MSTEQPILHTAPPPTRLLKRIGLVLLLILGTQYGMAQLTAAFRVDKTTDCSPSGIFSFFDETTPANPGTYTYEWDLGNGVTSTQQNPQTSYTLPGVYTVRLTVRNGAASSTVTRTNLITINPAPTVDFAADDTAGCFKHRVNFTDFSTPGTGSIVSRLWDFGNGIQSTDPNPSMVYNLAGNYVVSLTVTNSAGCATTVNKNNYIEVTQGVVAGFFSNPPTGCRPPVSVQFNSTSTGPGTLTYAWDLGNGTTSTLQNPQGNYSSAGAFNVRLTVTSDQGCFDTLTRPIVIPNTSVSASFSAPDTVCLGQVINFVNTSVPDPDPGGSFWTFGDGTTSTALNPVKSFNTAGTFQVKLRDQFGACLDSFTKPILVLPAPAISFSSPNAVSCRIPHTVNFTANAPGGVTFTWDFGDGRTGSGPGVSHQYTDTGNYPVRLTVTNPLGCPSVSLVDNFVRISPPRVRITNLPDSGCLPLTVTPNLDIRAIDGIQSWFWDFGDGFTSTSPTPPTHTYTTPGNFRFSLRIVTNGGCADSVVIPNAITVGSVPTGGADFTGNPLNVCAGTNVNFVDLSPNPIFISGWQWRFGDGSTSPLRNPIHQYADTGKFDVTLVIFSNGCGDSTTKTQYVTIGGAVARFNYTVDCASRTTVQFRDSSLNATSILWDFGGGNTSTAPNPTFTFPTLGNHVVKLTATNGSCSFTLEKTIELVREPATFTVAPNPVCKGARVTFSSTGSLDSNIVRYEWDFGDGNFLPGPRNVANNFIQAGVFNTRLRITDINGCIDSSQQLVPVGGPTAGLGAINPTGCRGFTVDFIDSSRTDGVNAITQRIWDFGDGTRQIINNPPYRHRYDTFGSFNVRLIVQDAGGCQDSIVYNNFVTASQPRAAFRSDSTLSCPGSRVEFKNETNLGSSSIINNFTWTFGDGTVSNVFSSADLAHTYTVPGIYTVKLVARDRFGCEDSVTRLNYIRIDNPVAAFTLSDSISNCPPLNVNMRFTGSYQQDVIWDFGDGAFSDTLYPSRLYNTPGNYRIGLTVISPGGCRDTLSKPITIFGPTAEFDYTPLFGCDSLTVNFRAFNTNNVDSIVWEFRDGKIITADTFITYTYRDTGDYIPQIFLQDKNFCQVPIQGRDTVRVIGIYPGFLADKLQLCDQGAIQFTDTTIIGSSAKKTSWLWDFGDGNLSSLQNPLHLYTAPGLYTVSLTVGTEFGCSETVTRPAYIRVVQSPITDISASTPAVCQQGSIVFQGIETVPDTSVLRWYWDFANGQNSDLQNPPAQVYPAPGTFTVQLITTNSSGCTDTTQQLITINPLPTINVSADSTICLGESVTLQATGGDTYTWLPPVNGLSCTDCPSPIATPAITTTYLVQGTTLFGCSRVDSVKITVVQPSTVVAPPDDSLCVGQAIVLRASGTQVYTWSPATGLNNINLPNPIARPTVTTTYVVTGSDFKGCFTTVDSVLVEVFNLPTVDLGPDITVTAGTTDIPLNSVYSNDVLSLLWSPSTNLSCTTCPNPLASPKVTTTYTLKVTNNGTCIAQDAITITVVCLNSNVFMPNTFSPNGDGVNEIYYPRGRGINTIRSMKIFSRWGQLIYSRENFNANDPAAGWDGRFRGAALPPDVYVYMIDLVCENQTIITLKGDIMLVR